MAGPREVCWALGALTGRLKCRWTSPVQAWTGSSRRCGLAAPTEGAGHSAREGMLLAGGRWALE